MKKIFQNLFSRQEATPQAPQAAEQAPVDALAARSQSQSLRMELNAREQRIAALEQELELLHARQDRLVAEMVSARMEALLSDLAGPASQINTQSDLLENQNKPVQARDVLLVARRMVRALERHGLTLEGNLGEQVAFDPNRHTPLNGANQPQPGQPVTIRFVGVAHQGKILYKAIVE